MDFIVHSHTQRSSFPSEILAPEINASNIDYLEMFDELKEAENAKSNISASLEKSKTIESIEEPKDIGVKEENYSPASSEDKSFKYSAVMKKGKRNKDGKKLMAVKSVELQNEELAELENQDAVQNDKPEKENIDVVEKVVTPKKILATKTPDTSPDQPPQVVVTFAQIHHQAPETVPVTTDTKQKPVKKSGRPLKKTTTEDRISQELRRMEESFDKLEGDVAMAADSPAAPNFGRTRSSERIRSRRLSPVVVAKTLDEDFDKVGVEEQPLIDKISQELRQMEESFDKRDRGDLEVDAVASDPPAAQKFGRTRSSERIRSRRLSPAVAPDDDFDKMCREEQPVAKTTNRGLNKSVGKLNATSGSTSRRLFDPANLDYLDQMPALAEQLTPEFKESPIVPPVKDKLPKKTRKTSKKRAQVDPESSKPKTETKKAKGQAEKPKKPVKKLRGKRNFEFNTLDFKTLDELFDKSCSRLASRTGYSGFNPFNATSFKPLVVRAAPIDTSSDESPKVLSSMLNKNVIPGMKYTPDKVCSSSDFSWPELEIERGNQTKKIRILQDIVIKPKRPQPEQIEPPKSAKRKKLDFDDDEVPHVPVPAVPLPDEDRAIEAEMAAFPQRQPIVPFVRYDRLTVPPSRSPREALQYDQYSAALPEHMECVVAQEDTAKREFDEAILLLEQMMNPVVLRGLQTIVNHREDIWQLLQSRQQ